MATKQEILKNIVITKISLRKLIHDSSHIAVQIKTKGFLFQKKSEIHISGRVEVEKEKLEIDEILVTEFEGIPVFNNLSIRNR